MRKQREIVVPRTFLTTLGSIERALGGKIGNLTQRCVREDLTKFGLRHQCHDVTP